MKKKITFEKSSRQFQLWEFQASHGMMLIRSPKSPAAGTEPEYRTNIDLVFSSVSYMAVPRNLKGLEVVPATAAELDSLKGILGEMSRNDAVFVLASGGNRFPIVAWRLDAFETDWDIFESPIAMGSKYRAKP